MCAVESIGISRCSPRPTCATAGRQRREAAACSMRARMLTRARMRRATPSTAWLALASVFLKRDGSPYQTVTKKSGFPDDASPAEGADARRARGTRPGCGADRAARRTSQSAAADILAGAVGDSGSACSAVLPVAVAELQIVFQSQGQAGLHRGARCERCRRWDRARSRPIWRWPSTIACSTCWSMSFRTRRLASSICSSG